MSTNQINQKVNTKRERRWEQAVRLAREGKTYWQIAREMGISQKGVWLHLVSHGYSLSQLKPKKPTKANGNQNQRKNKRKNKMSIECYHKMSDMYEEKCAKCPLYDPCFEGSFYLDRGA